MTPPAPRASLEEYGTAIEDLFIRRRGTPFLLAAKDWTVLRGWFEAGVALPLVLTVLEELFARREAEGKGKVSSLRYFADAVEERWSTWLQGRAGAREEAAGDAPAGAGLAGELPWQELQAALGTVVFEERRGGGEARAALVEAAAAEVAELARTAPGDLEAAEGALAAIESRLLGGLQALLDEPESREIEAAVALMLQPYSDAMSPERYRETFTAGVRQALRQRLGLPVLSIF